MSLSPLAGKPARRSLLVDVPRLVTDYFSLSPEPGQARQRVSFGTSGHRGTSFDGSFNEAHVLAMSQAVADHRRSRGVTGPLFLGADTHALSTPALITATEVLSANGVHVVTSQDHTPVPTPVVSHAILTHNLGPGANGELKGAKDRADGIVITPSHNPPEFGGFKYNPPHGGPAGSDETDAIEKLANRYLESSLKGVKRLGLKEARASGFVVERDLITPYVDDLGSVLDLEAVKAAGVRIGVDPLGGSSLDYWEPIAERWGLELTVVNRVVDPTFGFMTVDHDGKIRMDCSSPYAMENLIGLQDDFDVAFGNDPDADRHGIVTKHGGLMNPNHYLAVAVEYLFSRRTAWPADAAVGKTLVSSSMIDRVTASLGRNVAEVPVGFKWFVDGLLDSSYGFGGEESAGASFLRKNGRPWSTDKDGLLLGLLAAEITAVTGDDPVLRYQSLEERFGVSSYARLDVPANAAQKQVLKSLDADDLKKAGVSELAGEKIVSVMTTAPANGAPIGGIKVVSANSWFAARPSGTEDLYKIYAESFGGDAQLDKVQSEAQEMVAAALKSAGV